MTRRSEETHGYREPDTERILVAASTAAKLLARSAWMVNVGPPTMIDRRAQGRWPRR
jgi:hypothetical protein